MREVAVRAPGRVNLIGDHTDYNEGFVLPMAIDLDCRVRGHATSGELRLRFLDGGDDDSLRIAQAVREALGLSGVGLDAEVTSTVPVGRGLSSSSALAVALAVAYCDAAGVSPSPVELARACQAAETAATGVPGGIMDQLTSVAAQSGSALLIDCRSLELAPIPVPETIAVVVVDSGVRRRLSGSAYAERREACEVVAAHLGVSTLRDATSEQVAGEPRARHVVSENARVLAAADALRIGDLETLGRLMLESHASLRDDYEVSTPGLDSLVGRLVEAGAAGARLTGAGFGGCVVAVTRGDEAQRIAGSCGGFVARAVGGAGSSV